jgi:hypothetical protein
VAGVVLTADPAGKDAEVTVLPDGPAAEIEQAGLAPLQNLPQLL